MQMAIIDEFNEYEKKYNLINVNDLKQVVSVSTKLDLDCLSFVSFEEDTIFNQVQMRDILKEIDILSSLEVSVPLLDLIKEAVYFGLQDDYRYLKFENQE